MDDPAIAEADHLHALGALATINAVSRTSAHLARAVGRMLAASDARRGSPLTVVDIGCGGGDVTIALARRLGRMARAGSIGPVRVLGVDNSPRAVQRCGELAARRGVDVAFEVRDVIAAGCPPCDVAVSSLFLHHFADAPATRLLRDMAASARRGVVVSDLIRSRVGLTLAVLGTTLLSTSQVARVDGPLSVRAARTTAEYHGLCADAGLHRATIRRIWPERVLIRWTRDRDDPGGLRA
jgi:2-polyprenyl-3-methyl-5-hydroxy-6-metoxy-1,4-benzoquinol methylase